MVSSHTVVFAFFAVIAVVTATDVHQCPGRKIAGLRDNVQLSPCKKPPCLLKKGTNQNITVHFETDRETKDVVNHVTADVFGVTLPFIGVDGNSICGKIFTEDGNKASCPLIPGTKYIYKDSFPVLSFYPSTSLKVHWSLGDGKKSITCFELPARIS